MKGSALALAALLAAALPAINRPPGEAANATAESNASAIDNARQIDALHAQRHEDPWPDPGSVAFRQRLHDSHESWRRHVEAVVCERALRPAWCDHAW